MGQFATVSDVLGEDSHVFTYNDDLQLETETIGVDGIASLDRVITRKYWGSESIYKGKDKGFTIGTDQDPDADYDATCYYAALLGGRLLRVTGPGLPAYGAAYSTISGSHLLSKVDFKSDSNTVVATADWTYEFEAAQNPTHRNLIRSVENIVKGTPDVRVSKYTYASDDLGRRTSVVYEGTAFAEDHLFKWGYNDRSELTAADRHQGTDPDNPGTQYGTNGDFVYAYDPIGNRETYTLDGGTPTAYTRNNVNQYTQTAYPSESFDYDDDGNLTEDGTYVYDWDGENRLISVAPASSPVNGDKVVEFLYDYMSRRIAKQVYTYNGSSWSITQIQYFIYDGWNVVLVMDVLTESVARKYTWGLDLSGAVHGAGGVGGLLAAEEPQTVGESRKYWYLYDANGNVGQLLKASDQSLAARYEYDPYGNTIASTGPYADTNPFRFSTKWLDSEAGLYCYGYRYYSAHAGRWINRDPMEEEAGANVYCFVLNDPVHKVDHLGLKGLAGHTLCHFGTGIPVPMIDLPNPGPCHSACIYAHEFVHVAQQLSCCMKAAAAMRQGFPYDPDTVIRMYSKWVEINEPIFECMAYPVGIACEVAAIASHYCPDCEELLRALKSDAEEMADYCSKTQQKYVPCPFP